MKRVGKRKGKTSLFHPSKIATAIEMAIKRDLGHLAITEVRPPWDPVRILANRQIKELLKKFNDPTKSTDHLEAATFEKFLKVNAHMGKFRDIKYPDADSRVQRGTRIEDKILIRARALMRMVLSDFTEEEWFLACKHGQGATVGVSFVDTSMEAKFQFPISLTPRVKPLLERYLVFDFQLKAAIVEHNGNSALPEQWYSFVEGSRATTVEKNCQIRRMIAVEPTGNMFFQQGLMALMYRRMKAVGLDVESLPDVHRVLARESSITAQKATIDWSSASDCMSIELLRYLLPPKWFGVVDQVRSPVMSIQGHPVNLNMASTMGNAVTFPLETLVFWTIAQATRLSMNAKTNALFPEWEDLRLCSVFGDDCIVPSKVAPVFMQMLSLHGFLVNDDKSFYGAGRFRESCGGDYHAGYDVRPFNLRSPTSARLSALEPWLYIIANSLQQKYITCFGELNYVYDKELWRLLTELFAKHQIKPKLVPSFYPEDSGLRMSGDIHRFIRHYGWDLSPVARSDQGALSFRYMRFVYTDRTRKSDGIRLADWLKRPKVTSFMKTLVEGQLPEHPWYSRRRVGGYVVARGLSAHWTLPRLDPGVRV